MTATYVVGDVRECLAGLPDGSIDAIITSPPFLALRSYLPADHPDKANEIGSEPTPSAFLSTLLGLSAEFRRVLAPHGSICIELGDTYSGSGGAGGDYGDDGVRSGQAKFRQGTPRWDGRPAGHVRTTTSDPVSYPKRAHDGWPLAKSLCMVPELYRVALTYGIHPLTGEPSPAGRWRTRNVVRWCRPNPPVGALGDKVRPATSDMVIACTSAKRYFDLDAVRTVPKPHSVEYGDAETRARHSADGYKVDTRGDGGRMTHGLNPAGAPPLDHWWHDDTFDQDAWLISTESYEGSHYATWPRKLLTTPIKAMVPHRVCTVCGEPSRRITEDNQDLAAAKRAVGGKWKSGGMERGLKRPKGPDRIDVSGEKVTTGWTDCGHGDNWRTGVVLDPFGGSGTTGAVATGHGRDALLFDLDDRNLELARERIGPMFFTGHTLTDWLKVAS